MSVETSRGNKSAQFMISLRARARHYYSRTPCGMNLFMILIVFQTVSFVENNVARMNPQ